MRGGKKTITTLGEQQTTPSWLDFGRLHFLGGSQVRSCYVPCTLVAAKLLTFLLSWLPALVSRWQAMPFRQSLGKGSVQQRSCTTSRPSQASLQNFWQREPTRCWVVGPWPTAASFGVGPFVKGQDGLFVKDQDGPFVKDQRFVKYQGLVKGHKALLAKALQIFDRSFFFPPL